VNDDFDACCEDDWVAAAFAILLAPAPPPVPLGTLLVILLVVCTGCLVREPDWEDVLAAGW